MEFGIWSNGFRPHTSPAKTYEEDLQEIILADQLGMRDCYISEHHGEPIYIDKVDTLPVPELLMCKAAALTKHIRMGAAIKIMHLQHPVDVAIQAATADNVIGDGRFILGFGSGFPAPQFSEERGLTYDDRHERLAESLDFVLKCWESDAPFDWNGKHWQGKNIVAFPKPFNGKTMPMATATEQPEMIRISGERGYTLLSAYLEPAHMLRAKADKYCAAAAAVGRTNARRNIAASRLVWIGETKDEAIADLRADITHELSFQTRRGLMNFARNVFKLKIAGETVTIDDMVDGGVYLIGTADRIAEQLHQFYEESGGFGSLLIVAGKEWATREKRLRNMRLFMDKVAPALRHLDPKD